MRTKFYAAAMLAALLGFPSGSEAQATPSTAPSDFKIAVSVSESGIRLTCTKDCAWTELSFDPQPQDRSVTFDNFGMVDPDRPRASSDSSFKPFLLKIRRTNGGVALEGIEGTVWEALEFACESSPCLENVDYQGVVVLPHNKR